MVTYALLIFKGIDIPNLGDLVRWVPDSVSHRSLAAKNLQAYMPKDIDLPLNQIIGMGLAIYFHNGLKTRIVTFSPCKKAYSADP